MKTLITLLFFLYSISLFCQDTINDYYEEITNGTELNSNFGRNKFYKDVKIYVYGEKNDTLIDELNKIVFELNELIESINIEIVSDSTLSNISLYFGDSDYFCSVRSEKTIHNLSKICNGFFISYAYDGRLLGGLVFINTKLTKDIQRKKHVLREELTQSLGFGNDSYKYTNSIFYEGYSNRISYSDLDKLIIKKHYRL